MASINPNIHVVWLQGKHFSVRKDRYRSACKSCGYKKNKNEKHSRKKISNSCQKCGVFVYKDCFESFHTRSEVLLSQYVKSVCIRTFSGPYFPTFGLVISPNAGKYGPKKLWIRTLFTRCQ